jgi:hypothetical protein
MSKHKKLDQLARWVITEELPVSAAAAPYFAEVVDVPKNPDELDVAQLITEAFRDGITFREAVYAASES